MILMTSLARLPVLDLPGLPQGQGFVLGLGVLLRGGGGLLFRPDPPPLGLLLLQLLHLALKTRAAKQHTIEGFRIEGARRP